MTVSWSTHVTEFPPAFLGEEYQAAFPVVGGGPGSGNALALATGESGLPSGLSITSDYVGLEGVPDGGLSSGHASGDDKKGAGVYTFTLTNGTTTQQFTINVYSSRNDPRSRSDLSVAEQAALRQATDE